MPSPRRTRSVSAAVLSASMRRQATPARRALVRRVNSKAKLLESINKIKNILKLTGQSQQYLELANAIRNYSELRGNSPRLNSKANAIFRTYGALPGGAAALGPLTKLQVARKLQNLAKIYSNRHGNALYEAGLRYGTPANPFGMVLRSVARRLA